MIINLEQEQKLLQAEIEKRESQIAPIQRELKELRERLSHINALLPSQSGRTKTMEHPPRGVWADLCRRNGWDIGGDSPHRVVRRKDPELHRSIPHLCTYDGRRYP